MYRTPKVSVIIATHNNVKTIGNCIDSLFSRTFTDIEAIVVDVNSTDGTKDLLMEMAAEDDHIIFLADSMGSIGHAKNIGMDHARAPYIIFADPEGYFRQNAIEFLCIHLDEAPHADMFTCATNCFGTDSYGRTAEDRGKTIGEANVRDSRKQEMDSRLFRSWMFDNITIYRSSYLRDTGIRFYERPGYGSQDSAFRFLSMAIGIPSISVDAIFNKEVDIPTERIADPRVVTDVRDEFRFLKEKLQEDQKLWWRMRLIYWQAYYDRTMQLYELISDDIRPSLSNKIRNDIEEAINKKEYSMDHFDISVRDEMELLMKSTEEFDRYQAEKIARRESARDAEIGRDNRLTEIISSEEEDEIERLSRESAKKSRERIKKNRLDRIWLMDEMARDMASLRMLMRVSAEEMGNIIGISGNAYKSIEAGKRELSWDQYLALLFVFLYNERTAPVVDVLGLYPEQLEERIKKGININYG
ncbi:glycosyltransferase family 2 protein [Oribacterium sp. NK2B42]|uniref:glycosyltransferase family 2 protein n=1 Tax=Oribacterium sp. NK2B42 TaxID=689781 RepID=UPI001A994E5F|nr:glycosyltransferase family 2 protein [Oribacterium sp. NK2B42]